MTADDTAFAWPKDPFQPPKPDVLSVRPDRPRLIAPAYKWQALPTLIKNDPYLKGWNDTIFGNATNYLSLQPVKYNKDGASGILDNAREIKMRIKAFAYAYRMTNDTKWVDRTWSEVQVGRSSSAKGPNLTRFIFRMLVLSDLPKTNGTPFTSSTLLNFRLHTLLHMIGCMRCGLMTRRAK